MTDQDWTPVVLRKDDPAKKSGAKRAPGAKARDNLLSDDPDPPKKPELEFRIKLAQARMKAKLTQSDLAKKISEQVAIIQRLENGTELPTAAVLQKIKKVLNKGMPL